MMKDSGGSATFIRELQQQVGLWLVDGIIDARQRDLILARYNETGEIHQPVESDKTVIPSRLILTLSILGVLLLGAGIILFFSAHWSAIPNWGKIAIVFAGMLSSYGTGYHLSYEKGTYPGVGASLFLLGAIIYGAGIFLIAQAYNVSSHSPIGILMWGAGVLPMAYAVRLKPLLALSIVTLLVWIFMEISPGFNSLSGNSDMIPSLFLGVGVTLWGIGLMHEDFSSLNPLSFPYLAAGLPLTYLAAYVFTFKGAASMRAAGLDIFEVRAFYIGIGCIFLLSQALRLFCRARGKWRRNETLLLLLMIVFTASPYIYSRFTGAPVRSISLVLSNLIYAAAVLWIIFIGYLKRSRVYVNVGVVFFALDVLGRYVDILWGMLHTSLFFLLGGALLIALGVVLEKKRRKLLAAFGIGNYED
ncbi:MAG: DUF2157 domain-containing protein [Nitrospirae bacterium]|nr:DUF2157 domain-containing protein [Nitrospirota bacterium]